MVELLAPAGDFEGMEGAISAGADAVYAGGMAFGARAYARNFDREAMLEAIDYVHIHGKKLYLTVNTLVKNTEMKQELYDYLAPYQERGLDAVIVQDMGVLQFIREQFPELPIHASTQMTVTGPEGMRFLEEKGVTRAVTARELSLEEIRQMHKRSSLEIETFIHGALCYCYSGQCLFSSILGGRSGNRGRCAQPCRLPYEYASDGKHFRGGNDLHPLSPKDMCALELLPQIIEAGVYSLKIEGRMKQAGYTAGVVEIYRKYLDSWFRDPGNYRVDPEDRQALLELFSRGGSHEGYFRQHNGPSMIAFHSEKKIGNAYPEISRRKAKVRGMLCLRAGEPMRLELCCGPVHFQVEQGMVQEARNQPMTRERILQQMEKTGETPYEFETLDLQMDENIFVPVKILNELRRNAFGRLTEELCRPYRRAPQAPVAWPDFPASEDSGKGPGTSVDVSVSCETKEQLHACLERPEIHRVYLSLELACGHMSHLLEQTAVRLQQDSDRKDAETRVRQVDDSKKDPGRETAVREFWLSLPHVVRAGELDPYQERIGTWMEQGLAGFLARNLETYAWLKARGYGKCCRLDASMYTWNDWSRKFWQEEGIAGDTVPVELNYRELRSRRNGDSELLIYGYLPLMVSAQCVQKNLETCRKNDGMVYLRDRYQKKFPVKCYCDFCYNVIYNSLPYGLLKEAGDVQKLKTAGLRMAFTIESGKETKELLQAFLDTYLYQRQAPEYSFTKGHWKRGVE